MGAYDGNPDLVAEVSTMQTRLEYAEFAIRTMQAERDEARRERGHAWTELETLKAELAESARLNETLAERWAAARR